MLNLVNGFIRPRKKWGKKKRKSCGIPKDVNEFFDWAYDHGIIKTARGKKNKEDKNHDLYPF